MKIRTANQTTSRATLLALLLVSALTISGCATKKFVAMASMLRIRDWQALNRRSRAIKNAFRTPEMNCVPWMAKPRRPAGLAARLAPRLVRPAPRRERLSPGQGQVFVRGCSFGCGRDFKLNSDDLSDSAKGELDSLASRLKADNRNVFLEIEGHTDSSGPEAFNLVLGQRRAESVRRYLNGNHSIPLHRMSVITYGGNQAFSRQQHPGW